MSTDRRIVSTYRLQLGPDLTFDEAAAQVAGLADLGVSHLYLSPILQASQGSTHGYDVVDHSRLADGLGGAAGFRRLVAAAHGVGLGLVVDLVPNHMATPVPVSQSGPLWSLLRQGPASPYARWFDIDWAAQNGKVLWPVLGAPLEKVLAAGELTLDRLDGGRVVRYFEHVLPLSPDSDPDRMPLGSLLEQQHYRLASWREAGTALNYRRFFDVTSLIGVRVEDREVFEATHRLIADALRSGQVDGLRIDHPDGLADPRAYLDDLAAAAGAPWTVVEKILEGDEQLPASWACAGTTGYDALLRVGGIFHDPEGAEPLAALSEELLGQRQDLEAMTGAAKVHIVERVLAAEVDRLLRLIGRALPHLDLVQARRALVALLVGMDRYRVYVRPDEQPDALHAPDETPDPGGADPASESDDAAILHRAGLRGGGLTGEGPDEAVLEAVVDLAVGRIRGVADVAAQGDFVVRFQQTCGPVMAKGVEDTTFYRFVRLVGLNEVGGDPGRVGVGVGEFHSFAGRLARDWPLTMTTLSTHDTKRSEDVRARLAVLAERPGAWADWVRRAWRLAGSYRTQQVDALTEYLLWQTLVGTWPIDPDRLTAYAIKAAREAKLHTAWVDGDPSYEEDLAQFCAGLATDRAVADHVADWLALTAAEARAVTLGQKVVQLLMPGVPDVYQGTEVVDLSLVDPDNRRRVDHAGRAHRLGELAAGDPPRTLADEKLLVTAAALRLRRERPDVFVGAAGGYAPLAVSGEHAVAFRRGDGGVDDVCVVATRLAGRLGDRGGWGDDTVVLPPGRWRDLLGHGSVPGGGARLADVLPLGGLPVAILVRDDVGGISR
ncbi:malto-oligosyltrehalose synthase [Intrasporangium sp.]|uniref:malto-oligosyltrehalose synthase n=1 Tax=Intrasporangium sp. TaxID=1925024 RepID=UPI00293AB33F|nr:malto-oligosyltrehalose synthase [Intrasporangium sp.]MDV3220818.1 malto-oligosyltrehalose synthase [Intrasporangium sp.]